MKRFYKRRYRMIARVVWRYCRQGMGRFKGEWKKISEKAGGKEEC